VRFAFFLSVSVVAVLLFLMFGRVSPRSADPPQPPPPITSTASGTPRNIIVLDRSTDLGGASKLLAAGIRELVGPADFEGRVDLIEVRDTAIGYELIADLTVTRVPPAPSPVLLAECPHEEGAFSQPSVAKKRLACEDENFGRQQSFSKQISDYQAKAAEAKLQRDDLVQRIDSFASVKRSTEDHTEIRRALTEILRSRCDGEPCVLYIFSDLLDTDVKNVVLETASTNEEVAGLGKRDASEGFRLDGLLSDFKVVAWGIGRSDVGVDIQLLPRERERLVEYWKAFFATWGAKKTYLGFEFPSSHPG
jgi:hypothetical protein